MKLLIDMNLSPDWVGLLAAEGFEAVHWSAVGDPRATDETILSYAKSRRCVVFTHDLDFGAILAATGAATPSVVQIRARMLIPHRSAKRWFNCCTDVGSTLTLGH